METRTVHVYMYFNHNIPTEYCEGLKIKYDTTRNLLVGICNYQTEAWVWGGGGGG